MKKSVGVLSQTQKHVAQKAESVASVIYSVESVMLYFNVYKIM